MPKKQRKQTKRKPRMPSMSQKEWKEDTTSRQRLLMVPTILSTTVTTGVIATQFPLDPTSQVKNFNSRFTGTFEEYRVLRATFKVRPLTTTTGVTRFFYDRPVTGASATQAQEVPGTTLSNSQANSRSVASFTYTAKDFKALSYSLIAASPTVLPYFTVYTDLANFGAPATATQLWLVEGTMDIEFRGVGSS